MGLVGGGQRRKQLWRRKQHSLWRRKQLWRRNLISIFVVAIWKLWLILSVLSGSSVLCGCWFCPSVWSCCPLGPSISFILCILFSSWLTVIRLLSGISIERKRHLEHWVSVYLLPSICFRKSWLSVCWLLCWKAVRSDFLLKDPKISETAEFWVKWLSM